jgi:hypothetical protein
VVKIGGPPQDADVWVIAADGTALRVKARAD